MKHGFFLGLPGDIPGLALWLKADTGLVVNPSTGLVDQWYDQSIFERNAEATTSSLPTVNINNNKFVSFSSPAKGMFGPQVIDTLPCTIITVVNYPTVQEVGVAFQQYDSYDNLALYRGFNGGSSRAFRMFNGENLESTLQTNDNETFIMSSIVNGTNSSLFFNGNRIDTISTGATPADSGNLTLLGNYYIGYWFDGDNGTNVKIGEIIVYNRILSELELNTVHNYLKHKYGIQ